MNPHDACACRNAISSELMSLTDEQIHCAWMRWRDFAATFGERRECVEELFKTPARAILAMREERRTRELLARQPAANLIAA